MKKLVITLCFLFILSLSVCVISYGAVEVKGADSIPAPLLVSNSDSILDEAVFFGDSTTYGLLRYNVNNNGEHGQNYHQLKQDQIWVPSGGTFYLGNLASARITFCDGRQLSLADACREIKPKYLIVTVGINGLRTWTEDVFTSYYTNMLEIIEKTSPTTTVIVQSVYPTAEERSEELMAFSVDKVDKINGWIEKIAVEKGLVYLDTASSLKNERGYLYPEYQNGDGLHLNTAGFNAVLRYIELNL